MEKSKIEISILSCYGNLKAPAIAELLNIKIAKVYSTFRKFNKVVKAPYGENKPKPRARNTKRICTPYKTSQLR